MDEKPNFLIIMSDQHAPQTLGAMGHPAVKTPTLDRLAAAGVLFRNAYCPYPMCTPSRASFMTGHLTPAHGVWELGTPLGTDMPTWAHVMRTAGYATSISGRMHFVGHDKMHGFERRVHPELSPMLVPYAYGDWDKPQADSHVMLSAVVSAGPTETPTRAEQFDQAAIDAAKDELSYLTGDPAGRPWALTVGLILPHPGYQASRKYFDAYEGVEIPLPRHPPNERSFEEAFPEQLTGSRRWLGLTTDGADEAHVRKARRAYYAMITHMDEMIGDLISHLEATGAADNTWIVYLSDHGDNLGEHGMWSKLNFYEDSVRLPCIIAPPRCASAGKECLAPVSLIDWMPTLLELTGQQASFEGLPGRSLLPLLADPSQQWENREIISDYACDGTRVPMRMVRRGRWKASFADGLPPTLFDLEEDPYEWNDLGADPQRADVLRTLREIAGADGWEPVSLREEILLHKRRLKYISKAEGGP